MLAIRHMCSIQIQLCGAITWNWRGWSASLKHPSRLLCVGSISLQCFSRQEQSRLRRFPGQLRPSCVLTHIDTMSATHVKVLFQHLVYIHLIGNEALHMLVVNMLVVRSLLNLSVFWRSNIRWELASIQIKAGLVSSSSFRQHQRRWNYPRLYLHGTISKFSEQCGHLWIWWYFDLVRFWCGRKLRQRSWLSTLLVW